MYQHTDMKPIRVLIMIDRLGRGGVAQVTLNVAKTLNSEKFSPIVCTTRDAPTHGQDEILKQAGIPLVALNRRSRWQFLSWRALWRVLPTVDVLHTHQTGSRFWGRLWGKLFRVPVIITQEHTAADQKSFARHMVDRAMAPLSDRILTVSEFDRDLLIQEENLPPDKVETVYVGIDINKFATDLTPIEARRQTGLPHDKALVAVIARLTPQKNHIGLFQALSALPDELKAQAHCVLIGSGDMEEELREKAADLGLKDQVTFLGERTDVPVILRAIDLLVLPSHWECLPSVISEALATKCPVASTAVGGVPEMVGNIGWPLVPPGDVNALSEAIASVLQMPADERERIAEAGQKRVRDIFSKEASVTHLEQIYESLLQQKVRSGARRHAAIQEG